MGTEHLALLQVRARPFHHLPTGGSAEQRFCEFNWHPTQYAGGSRTRSRTCLPDPDDGPFPGVALAGQVDYLVTGKPVR